VSRWTLVAMAAAAMGVAGTYQFVWSSIRVPLGTRLAVPEAALGTVFTLFVVFQTVSQFPAGWVRDRYGPRPPTVAGAVLLVVGYALVAVAGGLPVVALGYALGGVGAGVVYTVSLNTAVKWFDDRRGLATGIVGMAYAGLSVLVIPVLRGTIETEFAGTLLALAALSGVVAVVAAAVLRDPPVADGAGPGEGDADANRSAVDGVERATPWRATVRTWQFWLLYFAFVVVNGVGLMVIGKVVAYAGALELTAATATAGASVVAIADASGIVVVSGLSDRLGRERTSAASIVLSGLALLGAVRAGDAGLDLAFVALIGVTAFFRSPVFATFPSLVGEYYGTARSSENYAVLYTAKLWGGIVGGAVASRLVIVVGWSPSFLLGGALLVAAGLALSLLRPPRTDRGAGPGREVDP